MGSQLQLESQPSVVSTFKISLALLPEGGQTEGAARHVDPRTLTTRGVLVVDGINTNRLIVERNAVAR